MDAGQSLYSFDQSRTFYINPENLYDPMLKMLHLDVGQSEWKEKLLAVESVKGR